MYMYVYANVYVYVYVYERWRSRDISALKGDYLDEFEMDTEESKRRYDSAFARVMSHTNPAESEAFWKALGVSPEGAAVSEGEDDAIDSTEEAWGIFPAPQLNDA